MPSRRSVLKLLDRRFSPWTSYPLCKSSSAKYEPSWPVIPVMSARFMWKWSDNRVHILRHTNTLGRGARQPRQYSTAIVDLQYNIIEPYILYARRGVKGVDWFFLHQAGLRRRQPGR